MSLDMTEPVIVMHRYVGAVEGHGTETLRIGTDVTTREIVVELVEDATGTVSGRPASHAERASYTAVKARDTARGQRRAAAAALAALPTPVKIVEYLRTLRPEDFA